METYHIIMELTNCIKSFVNFYKVWAMSGLRLWLRIRTRAKDNETKDMALVGVI